MALKKPSELFENNGSDSFREFGEENRQEETKENKRIVSPKELFGEIVEEEVVVEETPAEEVEVEVKVEDNPKEDLTGFVEEKIVKQTEEIQERLKEKFEKYSEQFEDKTKKYYQNLANQFNGVKENLIKKVSSLEVDILRNEQHLRNNNIDVDEIRQDINETIQKIKSEIIEDVAVLQEPPSNVTSDPLTPLDQNFVTFDHLNDHYRLFINRIQQQLTTLGGGGEYRFQYLDGIVGIVTNSSAYNGKYLQWNSATNKAEFVTVSGGGGSQTLNTTLGLGNTSSLGMSVGVITTTSINFASGAVLGDTYGDGGFGLKSAPNQYVNLASNNLQQYIEFNDSQIVIGAGFTGDGNYKYWIFDKNGLLSGPNNILTIPNAITTPPGNYFVVSSDTSTEMSWTGPQGNNIPIYAGISNNNTGTTIDTAVTDELGNYVYKTWGFSTDGSTQFPNSIILAPVSQNITLQSDQYSQLMWMNADQTVGANKNVNTDFYVESGGATLDISYRDGAGYQQFKSWTWYVDINTGDAGLRFPDYTTQYTAFTGYADNAGTATYAQTSGISTSVIGGIGSITQLSVSGVSTTTRLNVGTGGTVITTTSNGLVGIGTTNPTSKLHIVGDSLTTGIATVGLGTTSTPPSNSQMSFELISNTNLRIKVRGSDGILRSANITLA